MGKSLPANLKLDKSENLTDIAAQYELTGASILSAVQYATLRSYAQNNLINTNIIEGIRSEFMKEKKVI